MIRTAIFLVALMSGLTISAQITLNTATLDFGDVMTDAPQSQSFIVSNAFSWDVTLDFVSYNQAFSADFGVLLIPGGDSKTITVEFSPRHNIMHNSELVIYTSALPELGNLSIDLLGRGIYPDTYYGPTQDLSEEALKSALTTLISGHTNLGYNSARDAMYMVNDNHRVNGIGGTTQNKLVTAYTGRVVEGYIDRSDAQTNDNVNTEHTYPQSMFSSNEPMRSDMFHLYVTDATANSQRGNLPFGLVASPTWTNGGSKKNSSHFEPRDVQKGPTSRAMLYFLLRYGNLSSFVSATDEDVLVDWCTTFQADSVEIRRNEAIYGNQNNRNPLIDHPEFTERIHSFAATSVEPVELELLVTDSGTLLFTGFMSDYPLVLVATGNEEIILSDVQMSIPDYTILSAPSTISPGESGVVMVGYTPTSVGVHMGELTFTTNATNADSVSLQFVGGAEPTGIVDDEELAFEVFPNPVSDRLEIYLPSAEHATLILFDQTGRHLKQQQIIGQHTVAMDLTGFARGVYILSVETKAGTGRKRIIKM